MLTERPDSRAHMPQPTGARLTAARMAALGWLSQPDEAARRAASRSFSPDRAHALGWNRVIASARAGAFSRRPQSQQQQRTSDAANTIPAPTRQPSLASAAPTRQPSVAAAATRQSSLAGAPSNNSAAASSSASNEPPSVLPRQPSQRVVSPKQSAVTTTVGLPDDDDTQLDDIDDLITTTLRSPVQPQVGVSSTMHAAAGYASAVAGNVKRTNRASSQGSLKLPSQSNSSEPGAGKAATGGFLQPNVSSAASPQHGDTEVEDFVAMELTPRAPSVTHATEAGGLAPVRISHPLDRVFTVRSSTLEICSAAQSGVNAFWLTQLSTYLLVS
jgi:hypothetical protein